MAGTRKEPPARAAESPPAGTDGAGAPPATPEAAEADTGAYTAATDGGTIHARMAQILAELPALGKDSRNTQQDFMYRSHDAVLNALNPLMAKHGVYAVPHVLERIAEKRTTSRNSTMYEVNLHVQYTFVAIDGSWMQASAWGEGTDMGDKATNKAMTMAFKNVLAQAFAVSTQDTIDADSEATEETRAGAAAAAPDPTERANAMRGRIAELCVALDVQTQAEPGTWARLVSDATTAAFGTKYEEALPPDLEEIGKFLKAKQEGGITEAPEQLDVTVPF